MSEDFGGFYAANFRALTVQLYGCSGSLTEAQDVVQEAFCRALALWPKVSQYDDPVGWVRRVAWNLATSRWRRNRRLTAWTQCPVTTDTSPGPSPDHVDLVSALAALPWRHRQAVVLHYLGDVSLDEIAQISGVPVGTVKSWMSRARTVLAQRLSDTETIEAGGQRPGGRRSSAFTGTGPSGTRRPGVGITVIDPLRLAFTQLFESVPLPEPSLSNRTVASWKRIHRR